MPKMVDMGPDFISLVWTPPNRDGGNPVTAYVIEAKEKGAGGDFKPLYTTIDAKPNATVKGLTEGAVMEFRVRAINLAGPVSRKTDQHSRYIVTLPTNSLFDFKGSPSEATDPITIRHKDLAPEIDRTNLKRVEVKAGRTFALEVAVRGEPVR